MQRNISHIELQLKVLPFPATRELTVQFQAECQLPQPLVIPEQQLTPIASRGIVRYNYRSVNEIEDLYDH